MESLEQNVANVDSMTRGDETGFVEQTVMEQSGDQVADVPSEAPIVDEDQESRKFQSMYDRSQAELQELKKYEPLIDVLRSRPDLVKGLQDGITAPPNSNESKPVMDSDEFNPWDAWDNKKSSVSRDHVQRDIQNTVDGAVSEAMVKQERANATKRHLDDTVYKLRDQWKMSDDEIRGFLEFTTKPKEAVGLGNLVKLYRDVSGVSKTNTDTLDAVKAAQEAPRTAGVLQGQPVTNKSDNDKVWESIASATRSSRLP